MQTFHIDLSLQTRVVIPQKFLDEARKEAQADTATPFLRQVQARFPDDDDRFMLAVVTNALRTQVRHDLLNFMLRSQIGGSVSPVKIEDTITAAAKAPVDAEFEVIEDGGGSAVQSLIDKREEQV